MESGEHILMENIIRETIRKLQKCEAKLQLVLHGLWRSNGDKKAPMGATTDAASGKSADGKTNYAVSIHQNSGKVKR